jgi:hypothetical protein
MKIITKGLGQKQLIITKGYGTSILEAVVALAGKPILVFKKVIRKG